MSHRRAKILDRIEDHLRQRNELNLLQTLPLSGTLTWRTQIADKNATRKSLVIGHHESQELVAVLVDKGKNGHQAKFYTKGAGDDGITVCKSDAVPDMNLVSPFKYIAGRDKTSIRVFGWFIKYYFMAEGLIDDCLEVASGDFWRRFRRALELIHDAETSTGSLETTSPSKTPNQNFGRLNSTHANHSPTSLRSTPVSSLPRDVVAIRKYLSKNMAISLLKHIPHVDEMQFENHFTLNDTLSKRLFLGNSIWACVLVETHEIEFLIELDDDKLRRTSIESFILEDLIYPFYTANSSNPLVSGVRLSALINWYFVAAGVIINLSARSIHQYGTRLHDALENVRKTSALPAILPHLLENQLGSHQSLFNSGHEHSIKEGSSQVISTASAPLATQGTTCGHSNILPLLLGNPQKAQIKELDDKIENLEDNRARLVLLRAKEEDKPKGVGGTKRQSQIEDELKGVSTELTELMKKRRKLKVGFEKC